MAGAATRRPPFKRRERLSDELAGYIRELIMTGELRSSQVINIDSFAREAGVSATPVREALTRLVSEGFLLAEQNRGFLVAPFDRKDIEDIFSNHAQIGGELAARAAANVTPEFLEELDELQAKIERCVGEEDLAGADAANTRFHEAVIHQAASAKLAWLFDIGVRYIPTGFFYPEDPAASPSRGERHLSIDDHRLVLEALRGGDPEKAREAMSAHIKHASKILVKHLDKIGLWREVADDAPRPRAKRVASGPGA